MVRKILNKIERLFNKHIRSKIDSRFKLNYKGKGIINFIDIGSVGGLPEPWDSNAHKVKFLLNFEPNDEPRKSENFMTYNTAVWETEEVRPFYIYRGYKGTGSSLFEQNFDFVEENFNQLKNRGPKHLANTWFKRSELVKTIQLKCRSLDSIISDNFKSKKFHFIKIDAQGAELNILKGANDTLNHCVGLYLELFNLPLYKGIALIDEVEQYLKGYGFSLIKKFPAHGTFNSQNDCLFLKMEAEQDMVNEIKKVYNI